MSTEGNGLSLDGARLVTGDRRVANQWTQSSAKGLMLEASLPEGDRAADALALVVDATLHGRPVEVRLPLD